MTDAVRLCDWCNESAWVLRCPMCDPRNPKSLCSVCAALWHARGFSQEHRLKDRDGRVQSYLQWQEQQQQAQQQDDDMPISPPSQISADGDVPVAEPAVEDAARPEERSNSEGSAMEFGSSPLNAFLNTIDGAMLEQPSSNEGRDSQASTSNDATDGDNSEPPPSVQESSAEAEMAEQPTAETAEAAQDQTAEPNDEPAQETREAEDELMQDTGEVAGEPPAPEVQEPEEHTEEQVSESDSTPESLQSLLARNAFDHEDAQDRLAELIDAAIQMEDAVLCIRYARCTESTCKAFMTHYSHCKDNQPCADDQCQEAMSFYRHCNTCPNELCPFCVRVKQRQMLGMIAAYDIIIAAQKRTLQSLANNAAATGDPFAAKAKRNFCEQQIKTCNRKRVPLVSEVERLNRLVIDHKLPVFNFPRYAWHLNEPVIKSELQETGSDGNAQSRAKFKEQVASIHTNRRQSDVAVIASDRVNELLRAKATDLSAQKDFEQAMDFGCAVVEASFCSSAKTPYCVMGCQTILTHLQHHVDLAVCQDRLCAAVEDHFSHLSKCKMADQNKTCEYCLRVAEREFARAVEMMELEQPDSEAKVQAAINSITHCLSNDPPSEREQTLVQLEDELEQAEDYKRDLLDRLSTSVSQLRNVRQRIADHVSSSDSPLPALAQQKLPVHFIKTSHPRSSSSSHSSKGSRSRHQETIDLTYAIPMVPGPVDDEYITHPERLVRPPDMSDVVPGPARRSYRQAVPRPRPVRHHVDRGSQSDDDSHLHQQHQYQYHDRPPVDPRALLHESLHRRSISASARLDSSGHRVSRRPRLLAPPGAGSTAGGSSLSSSGVNAEFSASNGFPPPVASLRGDASFLLRDMDAARRSVDRAATPPPQGSPSNGSAAALAQEYRRTMGDKDTIASLQDSSISLSSSKSSNSSTGSTAERIASLAASLPLPPDSTISAQEVIRESMASARSTAIYTDKDDFMMRGDSLAFSRVSDANSLGFSFSSRSTFRRSTISEAMLYETELFEPERELSAHELSEVLSTNDDEIKSIEVTSIKQEEEDVKLENAKSRWAQQVKLKARSFLHTAMIGKTLMPSTPISPSPSPPPNTSGAAVAPPSSAQAWAGKQKVLLSQYPVNPNQPLGTGTAVGGAAKLQKWNRWMHDQYQHNIGKVMQRGVKDDYYMGQQAPPNPSGLISIEEVISNPRMMRYYAAWLNDIADQSKLFFLCSFEEYRQFWCTLRSNYQQQQAAYMGRSIPFSKDDVLMLRTYGVKIAMKYLARTAQFHIGTGLVDSDMLRAIKRDLAAGGEDALRTFDLVATKVKRVLMETFPEFRKTDLYAEMQKSVEREVICLEDILMNHRFANFFWIFVFPHNYHRELALWLDVEYEFKPAYRQYISLLRSHGKRKERKDQAAFHCRKLLKYISEKYYAGDDDMRNLEKSLSTSCAKLQHEQDNIIAKFSLIHLELYHRFLTSRAYAEFALYPNVPEGGEYIDDLMRLSALLLSYGLRAHHWPDASRETQRKRSLEVLHSARGYEAIAGVLTFESMPRSENGSSSLELRVAQHPLPHDPTPVAMDKSIENFLVPWFEDTHNVIRTSASCPPPVAFNFRMGDQSSSTELFAACLVIFKPAPMLSVQELEKIRLEEGSRWVPYGVCITSKFPLVDLLRDRLAEAYEFILELESLSSKNRNAAPSNGRSTPPPREPFQLDKKVLAKLARPVSLENISQFHHQASASFPSSLAKKTTPGAMLALLPRLDHSVRLLFDTLDISTVLMVFTAALQENRILFVSSYMSVLMKVCESLRALLYPLLWPHVYLPVLPACMLQYLECPTPFIMGVDKSLLDETTMDELMEEDILMIDLDKGCVLRGEIPCSIPSSMHYSLREALYECLKPNVSKSDHVFASRFPTKPLVFPDIAVRSLFLRTVLDLIGDFGYHRYVWTDEYSNRKMVFLDEASYLAASPPETREFRTLFIATQAFSEFMVSHSGFEDQIGSVATERER